MSDNQNKTHFRKMFKSCYLAAVDLVEEIEVTIARVVQEVDASKKTKDVLAVAYFKEPEIRNGERLKPMVINATNAKALMRLSGSPYVEDWAETRVCIYVDEHVKFGRETVEGLRIKQAVHRPKEKPFLKPEHEKIWNNAVAAFRRDGNLNKVFERYQILPEHQQMIAAQAAQPEESKGDENAVA